MARGQILASRQALYVATSTARTFYGSKATFYAGACRRSLKGGVGSYGILFGGTLAGRALARTR